MVACPNCEKDVPPEATSCLNCGDSLIQNLPISRPVQEVGKPNFAPALSLIGGFITLTLGSAAGSGFAFSVLGSIDAGLFLLLGVIFGVMIILGAVLQSADTRSRVRLGSIVVLAATIAAAPFTLFGVVAGSAFSLGGSFLGFRWRQLSSASA